MMMRSVALRLTLLYLAIIMFLSISFSVVIYRISSREISRNAIPPAKVLVQFAPLQKASYELLLQERIRQGLQDLRRNLILLNSATLALGALVSYGLARRTLSPLEEAFEVQSRFTADASHELRTPLTAMQTSIEVGLRNPDLDLAKAKTLLEGTLDEVKKLSALSNGLLKLTRHSSQDLPKSPVSLKKIATDAVSQLALAAQNKNIHITNRAGNSIVQGDALSIREVIAILLDNAIKYSEPDTTIVITTQQQGRYGCLLVTDHGSGIKASEAVHIFDRFYRADRSRSRDRVEGYGLGLSIAKQIVEAHGGIIEVKSKVGEGSTFIVKLPLVRQLHD